MFCVDRINLANSHSSFLPFLDWEVEYKSKKRIRRRWATRISFFDTLFIRDGVKGVLVETNDLLIIHGGA